MVLALKNRISAAGGLFKELAREVHNEMRLYIFGRFGGDESPENQFDGRSISGVM